MSEEGRRIVLGLTGPIGSGCSELSKSFSNGNNCIRKFIKYFVDNGYFIDGSDGNFSVNFSKWDEEIKNLYNSYDTKTTLEKVAAYSELKKLLGKRQILKSFDGKINTYLDKKKIISISVSDIIIAHTIVQTKKGTGEGKKEIQGLEEDPEKIDKIKLYKEILNNKLSENSYKGADEGVADLVKNFSKTLIKEIKDEFRNDHYASYRELMQDFGDNLRRAGDPFNYYNPFKTGGEKSKEVKEKLWGNKDILGKNVEKLIKSYDKKHSFFIIQCLRNPCEVIHLRKEFPHFFLISLYAEKDTRKERIEDKLNKLGLDFDKKQFEEEEKRDIGKGLTVIEELYKQNVSECVRISDIAINNDSGKEELYEKILRYLALILEKGYTKPTKDELYMNLAYTISMRSNCISRQVGAVIVGDDGYIIGAGWNDVGEGQISCGLKEIKDIDQGLYKDEVKVLCNKKGIEECESKVKNSMFDEYDGTNYNYFSFCFKDEMAKTLIGSKRTKKEMIKEILNELDIPLDEEKEDQLVKKLSGQNNENLEHCKKHIKNLQQHCKSLHAEDNAIIQSSKIGGVGLKGGTIYVTTFPCEVCSKKICQVGIKKVVFVEPYRGHSVDLFLKDGINKVEIKHFEGVMPYSYIRLFKVDRHLKDWQKLKSMGLVD